MTVWAAPGADLRGVRSEGGGAAVMQRLDCPVPTQEVGEPGRVADSKGRLVIA